MADNTQTTAAEVADQSQQNCPLMKLPTELRLRIYKFAFDDIIDDIVADAASKKRMYLEADVPLPSAKSVSRADNPIFVGVLGFLHASRKLRSECVDALLAPTRALKTICSDRCKVTAKACYINTRDGIDNLRHYKALVRDYRLRRMEYDEALYRGRRMNFIYDAVALIV